MTEKRNVIQFCLTDFHKEVVEGCLWVTWTQLNHLYTFLNMILLIVHP